MAAFVRRLTDAPGPEPGLRILKRDDYLAALASHERLAQTETEVQSRLAQADAAYEERRAQSYADGLAAAQAQAAAPMLPLVDDHTPYLARSEKDIADAVMACLRKVLGEFEDAELVSRLALEAANRMRGEARVTLKVRPEIEQDVRTRLAETPAAGSAVGYLDVVGDDALPKGGCRLESEAGVVECGLEHQLGVIERLFRDRTSDAHDATQTTCPEGPESQA